MFKFLKNSILKNQNLVDKYFDYLKERISTVRLFGRNESGKDISHELDKVFVDLTIVEGYERPSIAAAYSEMMDGELRRQRNFFLNDETSNKSSNTTNSKRVIKANELLLDRTHAFVTGAPQCGKTTLLRYLAWQSYKEKNKLSLFLELKTVREIDFKRVGSDLSNLVFQKSIADPLLLNDEQYNELRAYFYNRLEQGEVAIFLDGLDEVREESFFIDLCQLIEDFLQSDSRQNSLIVSARPFALHQTSIEGLKEVEIQPLNDTQINEFLSFYYGDNDSAVKRLKQVIQQQNHLREMGRVPFLLAVMVDLLRQERELGKSRLELYRAITLQLIKQLDKDKKVQRFAFQMRDPEGSIKLKFLKNLAFEKLLIDQPNTRHGEVGRLIFTDEILQEKAKIFVEKERLPNVNYLELSNDVKATSLLREIGDEVYAFAHLTLQEYLAAETLASHADCERIFCQTFFNPTLVEMEVLPMMLGLSPTPINLYKVLEQLSESLILTNLRLRIRGFNYITDINQPEFKLLLDEIAYLLDPSAEKEGFREPVLRSLKSLSENARQYLEDKMIPILKEWSSISKSKAADALQYLGSKKSIEPLLKALRIDASDDIFTSRTIGFSSHDDMVVSSVCRALTKISPNIAVEAIASIRTSYSYGNLDRVLKEIGTEEAYGILLKRRGQHLQWYASRTHQELLEQCKHKRIQDVLLEALNHRDGDVRGFAAETLGYIGLEEFVESLSKHLFDSDYATCWKTAYALGNIGSEKAVEPLLEALRENQFGHRLNDIRRSAAHALGQIRSEKAVDGLIDALKSSDPEVVHESVSALGWIESGRSTAPLIKVLETGDQKSRHAAAFALGRSGDKAAARALIKYLKDPDPQVRSGCAYSLGKINSQEVVDPLIEALSDTSVEVRTGAAFSLSSIKSEKSATHLIKCLRTDSNNRLKELVIRALGEIGTADVIAPLLEYYSAWFYSTYVAEAITKIDPMLLQIELPKLLNHENKYIRRRAVQTVGYYSTGPEVLPQIITIFEKESEQEVKKEALEAQEKYQRKLELFDVFIPETTGENLRSNESKDTVLIGEVTVMNVN
jgi:HEAT repeat protein